MLTKQTILNNVENKAIFEVLIREKIKRKSCGSPYNQGCPYPYFKNHEIEGIQIRSCLAMGEFLGERAMGCNKCWDFFLNLYQKNNNLEW